MITKTSHIRKSIYKEKSAGISLMTLNEKLNTVCVFEMRLSHQLYLLEFFFVFKQKT